MKVSMATKNSIHKGLEQHVTKPIEKTARLTRDLKQWRAVFYEASEFIGLLTLEGILIEANQTALNFLGISESDVIGKPFWKTSWWTHSPKLQKRLRGAIRSVAQGRSIRLDATHSTPDGELRYFDFSLKPLIDEGGHFSLMIAEGHDITEIKRLKQALRKSEQKYREFFNNVNDAIYVHEITDDGMFGKFFEVNRVACRMLGYSKEELLSMSPSDIRAKETALDAHKFRNDLANQGFSIFESIHVTKNGEKIPVEISSYVFHGEGQKRVISTVRDISRRKQAEKALRKSEDRFRLMADFSYDWEYWIGVDGEIVYMAPSCEQITGYKAQEFMDNPSLIQEITLPEDRPELVDHLPKHMRDEDVFHIDFRIITKDNRIRWISHYCQPVFDHKGKWLGRRASNRDISKRKRLEDDLTKLATTDALTGTNNRSSFLQRAEQEFERCRRHDRLLSVLMIDIDHFKRINDTFGHYAGDQVLKDMVKVCLKTLRSTDIFGRLGGEEFAAVLIETGKEKTLYVAERLRRNMEKLSVDAEGETIRFTISIGVAVVEKQDTDFEKSLKRADQALYQAKNGGRNRFMVASDGEIFQKLPFNGGMSTLDS